MTLVAGGSPTQQSVEFAGFRLDRKRRLLTTVDGQPIALNSRAFDTLLALIARRGETLSKPELLETVWPNVVVEENNLNQAISALRKALGDTQDRHRIIMTIPGRGYCFIADLRIVQETSPEPELQPSVATADHGTIQSSAQMGNLRMWALLASFTSVVLLILLVTPWRQLPESVPLAAPPVSGQPVALPPGTATVTPGILPNSVAVFPFDTEGSDAENEYFGLGLYDEVVLQLSQLSRINVIARNTMQQYDFSTQSAAEIARELRVGSVLEGKVLSSGNNLRISLQLTAPRTNVSLWSASYDADMDNMDEIFAIEADVTANVAKALGSDLTPAQIQQVAYVLTRSPTAYQSYMKAHAALAVSDYGTALMRLEEAVAIDPDFVTGWSKVSLLNTLLTGLPRGGGADKLFNRALEAADRAVAVNPDYALAHVARASALHNAGDWAGAADEYRKARELGAALEGSSMFSLLQMSLGDFAGAKRTLERNLRTDPVNLISRGFLMLAHEYLGERTNARAEYSKGEALYPDWWGDSTGIWLALGREDTDYLAKSIVELPNYALRDVLEVYASPADAVAQLVKVQLQSENYSAGQLQNAAMFAAYFDQPALALDFLRKGLHHNALSTYLLWLPVFDDLRKTEEFRKFLVEAGLVEYWQTKGWPQMCSPKGHSDFTCDWTAYQ